MQFMWSGFELSQVLSGWTIGMFALVLALALILFVAGAMVLPGATEVHRPLLESFRADGKWALVCLSAYFFLAFLLNPVFFGSELLGRTNVLALGASLGPALYVIAVDGRGGKAITAMSFVFISYALIEFSPAAYT